MKIGYCLGVGGLLAHNVSGISDVAEFKHHSRYEEPQMK